MYTLYLLICSLTQCSNYLFLQAASELRIRVVTPIPASNQPPTFNTPSPLLPVDIFYITVGDVVAYNFSIYDPNSILGISLSPVVPLPEGTWLEGDGPLMTGAKSAMGMFYWEPMESQIGDHVICFVSQDGYRLSSTPLCLTVVILELDLGYEVSSNKLKFVCTVCQLYTIVHKILYEIHTILFYSTKITQN